MTDNASRRRQALGNQPKWDLDLEYGRQAELLVTDIADSIKGGSVEVKRDGRWQDTNNIYVEYQCRRGGQWRPSGIAVTDADLWAVVLGDTEVAIIVPTGLMKQICRDLFKKGSRYLVEEKDGSHPTKGIKVPLTLLVKHLQTKQKRIQRGEVA